MKPALLLVDFQQDFLAANGLQPPSPVLISRAAALLQNCRAKKIPVFHVWTTIRRDRERLPHWQKSGRRQCVAGTEGHRTPDSLRPVARETIIHKTGFNGFAGGSLDAALKKTGCDVVILAGVHLHACVRAAATESLERHLQVFIAEDAIGSNDPVHAAATRRWLAGRCVQFDSAARILSQLAGRKKSNFIHRSPRQTGKILFEVSAARGDEIATAVLSAQRAGKKWRQMKLSARLKLFKNVAARLETAAPKLARQMAIEIGKPLSHAREEIQRAAANIRDVVRRARNFEFVKRETGGSIRREPLGVVALISPWNNPVAIPVGKIAPALIYGNSIVWKPAPAATKISETILKLLRDAGVPRGGVSFLTGDSATAQSLAANENINAVTLTGAAAAGFAIHEICARRAVPLQAELSGNNAAIVWHDADLADAAKQIAFGAFGFAGQRCTANRRVIVPEKLFERFWRELKIAAEKLVWGDPLEKITDIGPVVHAGKRDEHLEWISIAQTSGARVEFLFAGHAAKLKSGAYAQPVMIAGDDPNHPVVQEETMSPMLIVQRAKNFSHALELCNGVRHGLAAALFSRSRPLQKQFLARAQAGILRLNASTAGANVSFPFGGWKMSGVGPPEHGEADSLFYTRLQAVYE